MKILFVSSGNKFGGISPIVYNQGESLKKADIYIDYFTVKGKGFIGYTKAILPLYKMVRTKEYSVIHAHYSLSGFLATLVSPVKVKIIVSLMGTIKKNTLKYYLIRFLAKYRWDEVIVKSQRMQSQIGLKNSPIIPNGVQLEKFPLQCSQKVLKAELGLDLDKKIIIFVSDPSRIEKNFKLCDEAFNKLNRQDVVLLTIYNKPHDEVIKYMYAADLLMLTSVSEGSPNVIKEAMAAGCPIVTTDVGDVRDLLNKVEGTFVMNTFGAEEGASLINKALYFNGRTNGRAKLVELQLDSKTIAQKIIKIYNS
jgi:teichuronic acid biosynthesis glycosyltransferase TuaC